MKLSPDQKIAFEAMVEFAADGGNELMTIAGFAGTGKSTLLGVFAAEMRERGITPAYVTPTGRAASVLRKKLAECGIETSKMRPLPGAIKFGAPYCGTIHGLTKFPVVNPRGELMDFKAAPGVAGCDLLVVDEASMVGGDMLAHLQSFRLPILAVGDHGQLPPVLDSAGLMEKPDFRLEKIHRQAENNPIIALSVAIRETGEMPRKFADGRYLQFVGRTEGRKIITEMLRDKKLLPFDKAIICAYNNTRVDLNRFARDVLKLTTSPAYPKEGDLVICLKNLHALGIMNGMRGVMRSDAEQSEDTPWQITGDIWFPDEELTINGEWLLERVGGMCWPGFDRPKPFREVEEFNRELPGFLEYIGAELPKSNEDGELTSHMNEQGWPFDFGYAMTCHKAQGSQFSRVAVWLDRTPDPDSLDYRRWLYTATTRSSHSLVVIE